MAQIGFTKKQEHVYDRFQTLRRSYADKHGRTYAPGFLEVLMDAYAMYSELKAMQEEDWNQELISKSRGYCEEPVSLHVYAANAEANDPQYLEPKNE